VERIAAGTIWWRIHRREHLPLLFGPEPGGSPRHRFDAPGGEYRVVYVGTTRETSFAEVFLREPDVEYVGVGEIQSHLATQIRVRRPVALVALHGPGLVRAGVSAAATTGDDYPRSREAARGIWARLERPDGMIYRARHDDGELSVALFDRASDAIEVVGSASLDDDPRWLASMARRYGVDFTP
jgi:RES domain